MGSHRRSRIVWLVVVSMVLWQWGCAATRPIAAVTLPSPEVRAQLGVISIVSASEAPRTDLVGPTRGRGLLAAFNYAFARGTSCTQEEHWR